MRIPGLMLVLVTLGCGQEEPEDALLRVSLTNVSSPGALGGDDILLATGVWATLRSHAQLFTIGRAATPAFERFAEDADRDAFLGELMNRDDVAELGSFGDDVIGPGDVAQFEVRVGEDEHLQLAAVYVHGNDLVLGSSPSWPAELPLQGTIVRTASLDLYDAGTERNEIPGAGPNQLLQQESPGAGEPEDEAIGLVEDEFNYPPVDRIVELVIDRIE